MKKRFWVGVLCSIAASFSFAASTKSLTELLNNTRTMQADFVQTILDNHGNVASESMGKMALKRPGQFRWDVIKPIPQLIIATDSKLWIYDADLEQVTIRNLSQAAGDTPAVLLSHASTTLDKDYLIKEMQEKGTVLRWFSLVPKSADSMFASMKMGFYQDTIKEMRLEDHIGHTTIIRFIQIKVNGALPKALFIFKAPKKVDVIDETRRAS